MNINTKTILSGSFYMQVDFNVDQIPLPFRIFFCQKNID